MVDESFQALSIGLVGNYEAVEHIAKERLAHSAKGRPLELELHVTTYGSNLKLAPLSCIGTA